ncbi:alpha/beta-hydrolase [Schizophyllum commune H4-8]|uniref:alpha/beta-hydrolase n=1 Tax=Schizophyllum commune (strain H4-8 / FGSC 9210) TaxID=578458 RepID=UPI002160656E|nr:alpha/beta-hydrolase [Schizophyllum commune H4-8]KAI5893079.1 alpha/beta-hydrolase [Schizophyllum commune H4-8]
MPPSRVIPGRYPPPGTSPIADAIRERRGARGITSLDAALLHVPPVAQGWNSLLGAIRTKGKLPGDLREAIILRVAALNGAAYEWIHHEHVGRSHGLTSHQLFVIRNTHDHSRSPVTPGVLSSLQAAGIVFADASTKDVRVPPDVTSGLRTALALWLDGEGGDLLNEGASKDDVLDDLLVEAAAVAATYNMVSRLLLSLDVDGMADDPVAWPCVKQEHFIPFPSSPTHHIHAITLTTNPTAPWIALTNSLLTDHTMWDRLVPFLLAPQEPAAPRGYNVLLHDARGHGQSSTTPGPLTIPQLARDLADVLAALNIPLVRAVVGVSQGGAAALSFAAQFPHRTKAVVACDTGPRTPAGNRAAWDERIALVRTSEAEQGDGAGMAALADVTIPRWFPSGSPCFPGDASGHPPGERAARGKWVADMIKSTSVPGFALGASALQDYDLYPPSADNGGQALLESRLPVLLVAGSLDGGGKVGAGMLKLADEWNEARGGEAVQVEYAEIEGAGHLPMIDQTEKFWEVLDKYLRSL